MNRARVGVAVGALVLAAISPAHADTNGCVSNKEFLAADPGKAKAAVHRLFDTDGWFINRAESEDYWYLTRGYKMCRKSIFDTAVIVYRDRKGSNVDWRVNKRRRF